MSIKDRSIVVAFHQGVAVGPSFDLKKYFLSHKINELVFIAHPLTYIPEFYSHASEYTVYKKGKYRKKHIGFHWKLPDVLLYCKDILYTCRWVISQGRKYDIFFGVDPLNAFSGIILRKLGFVKKTVYYSIDYFSKRFENKVLNNLYHAIDVFCVKHADETWNLSDQMRLVRRRNGVASQYEKKEFTVPIGVWLKERKILPYSQINKSKVVFIGTFVRMMGIDLIIAAAPLIKQKIPGIRIDIIGSGPDYDQLRTKVMSMKLTKFVHFHGWVSNRKQLEKLMSNGAVGLAPFNPKVITDEIKNADPAKIKDYMLWGMPVIMTNAPSSTKELVRTQCVRVIPYDEKELAKEVITILKDDRKLKKYRENALAYVSQFDYEEIYAKNLRRVLSYR